MPDPALLELHGAQSRAKHIPLATVKFIGGLQTQRSPFASIDSRYNSRFLGGKPDALIAGSNCEISNSLTLQRRYGLSNFGPAIPPPLAFYPWRKTTPASIQTIVDTATAVYNYSQTAAGLLFYKSPGAGQTNFWGVNNTLYCGNGADLLKVVGPNLLTWSNTFTNPAWLAIGATLTPGQFDPVGGTNATTVTLPAFGVLEQIVTPNLTPVPGNTFTVSIWMRAPSGSPSVTLGADDQLGQGSFQTFVLSQNWQLYQVTATMGPGGVKIFSAVENLSATPITFQVYAEQLEVGGPATPTQITTTQPQGVYNWGIVAPTVAPTISSTVVAATWQASHSYNLGDTITDSNGNLQRVTTAGTSGGTQPVWAQALGVTTTDGATLVWIMAGANSLTPSIGYNWYYAFLDAQTGQPSNVSPISPSSTTLANNTGVAYTISGVGSPDPQVSQIAIYRNPDGEGFFFQVGTVSNPGGGGTWSFTDSTLDANLSSIYAPLGLLNSPPPAGAVNPIWHGGRMWVSVGSLLYYSSGPDNFALLNTIQNGVVAESFAALSNVPLDATITRSWSTSAGLLVETTSDVWLVTGSNLSTYDPVRVLRGHGALSYNASDMDGGTLWMYTSDRQLLSASSSAGTLEVGFPIGDTLQANVDPAKAYVVRHVSGSLDNAVFLGDGVTGWYRCNPNQVGASVSGEQTVVWSPFALITGGMRAMASIETTPGVKQLLVGAAGASGSVKFLGNIAGSGANSGSGTVWSNPSFLTLNNPVTPAFTDLNVLVASSGGDVTGGATGTSTAPSTGSLGPTVNNNELALACFSGNNIQSGSGSSTSVTAGSGWTLDASGDLVDETFTVGGSFSQHFCFGFEEQSLTATGSLTGNFSLSLSNAWAASMVTLKSGAGTAPTIVQKIGATNFVLNGFVSSISKTFGSASAKGNYMLVLVTGLNSGGANFTVTDSLGNLFVQLTAEDVSSAKTAIFIAPINASGVDTVTVNSNTLMSALAIEVYEVTLAQGAVSGGAGPSSQFLQATNFNLSLPAGAIPIGVKVLVTGSQTSLNPDCEFTVSWINPTGSAPSFSFQLPTTGGTVSFGGSSFTWGQSLTPSLLNSPAFGFQLQANVVTSTNVTFNVTAVQVQVFYLPTGGGGPVFGGGGTFDKSITNTGSSSPANFTGSPTESGELALLFTATGSSAGSGSPSSPGAGWNLLDLQNGGNTTVYAQALSGTGVISGSQAISNSQKWCNVLAFFGAKVPGVSPTVLQSRSIVSGAVGSGTHSIPFSVNTTAGSGILVLIAGTEVSNPITSLVVTDNQGNTYTPVFNIQNGFDSSNPFGTSSSALVAVWAPNIPGGPCTMTATVSVTGFNSGSGGVSGVIQAYEIGGVSTISVPPSSPITFPILFRDLTTFADVGTNFTWSATLGSMVLASEGTLAETESISVTTRAANGVAPAVAVLLDEIAGTFENLPIFETEPPQLGPSTSTLAQRYYLSQGTVPPICTHLQVQLNGGATNTRDEILRITIRGNLVPEQE